MNYTGIFCAAGQALVLACVLGWLTWSTGCAGAATVMDWCPTGLDAWTEGGYGKNKHTVDPGRGSDWSARVGVNVHWDLTGSCWDYEEEGDDGALDPAGIGNHPERP